MGIGPVFITRARPAKAISMAVRKVLTLGDPLLRKKAEPVDLKRVPKRNFRNLLQDMFDTMADYNGVGLAAPQVGISLRFFVKGLEENERYEGAPPVVREVVINPEIKFLTEDTSEFWEGCLSVPNMRGLVRRPNKIEVRYYDENLKEHQRILSGFEAIVFQHEYDHLDGILYVDRLVSTKDFGFNENLDKEDE